MSKTVSYRWVIDEDGGGTLRTFTDDGARVVESTIDFDSLEDLPKGLAEAIRDDGGTEGEFPTGPYRS
jgi:hypothetical protein